MGALLQISDLRLEPAPGVRGHVDRPKRGTRIEAGALDLVGWALGDELAVVAVELLRDGAVFRRLRLGVARPDLAEAFRDVPGAGEAGFRAGVRVLGDEPELALELRAVLADQRRVSFATLRAKRRWRESKGPERELVSVVIPCYDQAHFLGEAIESVLTQTYPHVELLVVDDGSHDNTAAVAARYPGVRYLRHENRGLAAARNTGIRHTNGDYLVFLDADDRLLPHALDTGLRHMRARPEAAFVAGHYEHMDGDGRPVETPRQEVVRRDPYAGLLRHNIAGMPGTVVYRRAVFEHVHGFDSSFEACEDYDLALRIAREFPVSCHDDVVALYRRHGGNASRKAGVMLESALKVHRRQRRHARERALTSEYRDGRRFWKRYYGEPLRAAVDDSIAGGRWREAAMGVGTLVRFEPGGVLAMIAERTRRPLRRKRRA